MKPISDKKRKELDQERPIRALIRKRSKGKCEYCGLPPCYPDFKLSPHEEKRRSAGGKLSLGNSKDACICCHTILQQFLPKDAAIRTIIRCRQVTKAQAEIIWENISLKSAI